MVKENIKLSMGSHSGRDVSTFHYGYDTPFLECGHSYFQ